MKLESVELKASIGRNNRKNLKDNYSECKNIQ